MPNACLERHLTSIWNLVFLVLLWTPFIQSKFYFPILCSVLIQAKILIDISYYFGNSYYLTYHNKISLLSNSYSIASDFWKSKIIIAINILNQITQVEVKFEKGFFAQLQQLEVLSEKCETVSTVYYSGNWIWDNTGLLSNFLGTVFWCRW